MIKIISGVSALNAVSGGYSMTARQKKTAIIAGSAVAAAALYGASVWHFGHSHLTDIGTTLSGNKDHFAGAASAVGTSAKDFGLALLEGLYKPFTAFGDAVIGLFHTAERTAENAGAAANTTPAAPTTGA